MAFAMLGKTLLFALLFITVCYGVLTFFADQSSLLENRPALVLGLLAAVLFFSLCFFVFLSFAWFVVASLWILGYAVHSTS